MEFLIIIIALVVVLAVTGGLLLVRTRRRVLPPARQAERDGPVSSQDRPGAVGRGTAETEASGPVLGTTAVPEAARAQPELPPPSAEWSRSGRSFPR